MAVVQEHNRALARAVRLGNDNSAPLGCESLIEYVLIYFGAELVFELLLVAMPRIECANEVKPFSACKDMAHRSSFLQEKASLILRHNF